MKAELTIPRDLKIQLDYTPCILPHHELKGSMSRPFLLPQANAKFFEFYNRINKTKTKHPITGLSLYSKGIKIRSGLLRLNKFTEDDKFDCDFIFDNAPFYSLVKDKYLNDIDYKRTLVNTNVLTDWYDYMTTVAGQSYPDVDIAFFPIYTSDVEIKTPFHDPDRIDTYKNLYPACLIANYWNRTANKFGFPETDVNGDAAVFLGGERAIIPFWYVGKVIEEIFTYAGYTIKDNVFKTDSILKMMVVFNLNTDREQPDIFGDDNFHISFKYDLPHILITDFVEEMRKRGILFIIKEDSKEVNIILLKDLLTGDYDKDYSSKVSKKKGVEYNKTSKIKFTGGDDGYMADANVLTALAENKLQVINSKDYNIDDDDETFVTVIRDEKIIRSWAKADYNDAGKTMFNKTYSTNNYYEKNNGIPDGDEIEITTKCEIIEDREITDLAEYSDGALVGDKIYKKLMPLVDAKRQYKNATMKEFQFSMLFNWGLTEMILRDDAFAIEPGEETVETFTAPFGSCNNIRIDPAPIYPTSKNGIKINKVYCYGDNMDPTHYKLEIIFENTTTEIINLIATVSYGTSKPYDIGGGISHYIRSYGVINENIAGGGTYTYVSPWKDADITDDAGNWLDQYVILSTTGDTIDGEIFYIGTYKMDGGAGWVLNKDRDAYRFYNFKKAEVDLMTINFIKNDIQVNELLTGVDENINDTDLPYNKGLIPGKPDISIALDKWVPYFLQEYVDMMLDLNTISVERSIDLSLEDLKNLTGYKKRINNPEDAETGDYLIEELQVAISGEGAGVSKVRLIKIN
jgi:hypothetical protein